MSHLKLARQVFDIELAALRSVRGSLNESFDRGVELVCATLSARRKIVVLGVGKSGNIGKKIAATLSSTGSTAVVLNPVDALHGDLGIVQDGDLILALSYSGESSEWNDLLPALRRFSVRIIALTGTPGSTLGKHSDVILESRQVTSEGAFPIKKMPTRVNLLEKKSTDVMLLKLLPLAPLNGQHVLLRLNAQLDEGPDG